MSQYSQLLEQLHNLSANTPRDAESQRLLYNALRTATHAVERPIDTVHRVAFTSIQSTVTRIAIDLKLFNILADSAHAMSLQQLAALTGADELLLLRLLRYLAANGLVDEPKANHYAARAATKTLSIPGFQSGVRHNVDVLRPCWENLPEFLAASGYKNITDIAHTPFQIAHKTDELPFQWALRHAGRFNDFNLWMAAQREDAPSWLDVFPHDRLTADLTSEAPLFVDVGGGIGHQCEEIKRKIPQLKRRIILQDLGPPIEHALKTTGVEPMVADFFEHQPIKGASFYYLKHVLHDYPDDKCLDLLENQVAAMDGKSVLLIDEMVLLDGSTNWKSAEMDIALMASVAAIERNESQWRELFGEAGLMIAEKYVYDHDMQQAVMVVQRG